MAQSKTRAKQGKKISAKNSQIKDLRAKLDQAVTENSQLRELLSPVSLEMAFTNVLQASGYKSKPKASKPTTSATGRQPQPFLRKHRPSQCSPGRDGTTDPQLSCCYCKDMGHNIGNCAQLKSRQDFLAHEQALKEGELN